MIDRGLVNFARLMASSFRLLNITIAVCVCSFEAATHGGRERTSAVESGGCHVVFRIWISTFVLICPGEDVDIKEPLKPQVLFMVKLLNRPQLIIWSSTPFAL